MKTQTKTINSVQKNIPKSLTLDGSITKKNKLRFKNNFSLSLPSKVVLVTESRASHTLDKYHSTEAPHPCLSFMCYWGWNPGPCAS